MSYFDNSTINCPPNSSPVTYTSYMCRSKNHYLDQDSEKFLKTVTYEHFWPDSRENYKHNPRFPPISKLRNILTETISTITKESQLQKGESVELTLEIELMETENNSPSHSLVEVTIVQHNKKDGEQNNCLTQKHTLTAKAPLQLETKSFTSESASQKRRSWFERVIGWQSVPSGKENIGKKPLSCNRWQNVGLDIDSKLTNVNHFSNRNNSNTIENPRSKFVKVLPDEMSIVKDFKKGYRKVSPENKSPRILKQLKKPTGVRNKTSVVKKLSNLFLPSQKNYKMKEVEPGFVKVKTEVNNRGSGKRNLNTKNEHRAQVPKLNKFVNNALADKVGTPNNASHNKIKGGSLPLKYQSFFEHISESKSEIVGKSSRKKHSPTVNMNTKLQKSHSDTCCIQLNYESSGVGLTKSNSVSNCRVSTEYSSKTNENVPLERGDSSGRSSKKHNYTENLKYKKLHSKNAKSDAKYSFKKRGKKSRREDSKKSLIEWNGQTIKVNRDVKDRIEMLIVNELQNLALKEGMECDVKPLASTESSLDNAVEKVSSYICELDISDKKIKKLMKRKESLESKGNITQSYNTEKHEYTKSKTKHSEKEKKLTKIKPIIENQLDVLEDIDYQRPNSKLTTNQYFKADYPPALKTEKEHNLNDIRVTYINMDVDNWSVESTTLKIEDSETNKPVDSKCKGCTEPKIFQFGEDDPPYKRGFYSGFVKKIDSKDTTWKNFAEREVDKTIFNKSEQFSKQRASVTGTRSTIKFSSATSNEDQSTIDIELDVKGLEQILQEAKNAQNCGKVIIKSVKCNQKASERKKQAQISVSGKNNPAYTTQLLTKAAQKLEKYAKRKRN